MNPLRDFAQCLQRQQENRKLYSRLRSVRIGRYAGKFVESKHPRGQPDNAGQFGSGGGGKKSAPTKAKPQAKATENHPPEIKIKPTKQRAFNGKQVATKTPISKSDTGKIGEAVAIAWLKSKGKKPRRH